MANQLSPPLYDRSQTHKQRRLLPHARTCRGTTNRPNQELGLPPTAARLQHLRRCSPARRRLGADLPSPPTGCCSRSTAKPPSRSSGPPWPWRHRSGLQHRWSTLVGVPQVVAVTGVGSALLVRPLAPAKKSPRPVPAKHAAGSSKIGRRLHHMSPRRQLFL